MLNFARQTGFSYSAMSIPWTKKSQKSRTREQQKTHVEDTGCLRTLLLILLFVLTELFTMLFLVLLFAWSGELRGGPVTCCSGRGLKEIVPIVPTPPVKDNDIQL